MAAGRWRGPPPRHPLPRRCCCRSGTRTLPPRRLVGDIAFAGIALLPHQRSSSRGQELHRAGRPQHLPASRYRECPSAPGSAPAANTPGREVSSGAALRFGRIPSGSAPRPAVRLARGCWRWVPNQATARPCRIPPRPASSPDSHTPASNSGSWAFRKCGRRTTARNERRSSSPVRSSGQNPCRTHEDRGKRSSPPGPARAPGRGSPLW